MKTYAKYINETTLDVFGGLTNMVYQDPALVKERATAEGYKLVVYHDRAHRLTELRYRETAKEIQAEWLDMPLEFARELVLNDIISWANQFKSEALSTYKFSDLEVLQKDMDLTQEELEQQAAWRGISVDELQAKIAESKAKARALIASGNARQGKLWDAAQTAESVADLAKLQWGGGGDGDA